MHNYTTTAANINSAAFRLDQRPGAATREQRIAALRKYLVRAERFSYTQTYREAQAELAALEGGE